MKLVHHYDGLVDLIPERRAEAEGFLGFLENETNWLTCPASTAHHLNVRGGLIAHSIITTRALLRMRETLGRNNISNESCVVAGLFHDVGKVGGPGQPFYIEEKKNGKVTYRVNRKLVAMGQGVRSLYLCAGGLKLTDEEAQAICYHDGQYIPDNLSIKNKEQPLTLLLHFADMWASHVLEADESDPRLKQLLEAD